MKTVGGKKIRWGKPRAGSIPAARTKRHLAIGGFNRVEQMGYWDDRAPTLANLRLFMRNEGWGAHTDQMSADGKTVEASKACFSMR